MVKSNSGAHRAQRGVIFALGIAPPGGAHIYEEVPTTAVQSQREDGTWHVAVVHRQSAESYTPEAARSLANALREAAGECEAFQAEDSAR